MTLVPIDPTSALAVTDYLTKARDWLATAVETSTPHGIANARAELNIAAEATKQLGLSQEIRDDAVEMVRRAEYAVSRSIRKGQEEGTVRTKGQRENSQGEYDRVRNGSAEHVQAGRADSTICLPGPSDLAPDYASNGGELRQLGLVDPEAFEQALDRAKAEGNLSRANVVRKVKGQNEGTPLTRQQRADLIADLAAQGVSSRQMPARVGVTEETVRQIARDFDIEIPADRIVGRTKRLDHTQMVESSVTDIENATEFIESFIDLAEVDFTGADEWVSSLSNSIAALTRFRKQIKEKTHV